MDIVEGGIAFTFEFTFGLSKFEFVIAIELLLLVFGMVFGIEIGFIFGFTFIC